LPHIGIIKQIIVSFFTLLYHYRGGIFLLLQLQGIQRMMGFLKKIILLGFCAGGMFLARAQVKFTASISPGQICKNEYAVLRLEVENGNNIENISPPSLNGFIVVSGPKPGKCMSNVNGVVKQYVALSYILQPQQTGNIQLAPATAKISGKLFKSNPLKIFVKKAQHQIHPLTVLLLIHFLP
jgi:hypothetical protein